MQEALERFEAIRGNNKCSDTRKQYHYVQRKFLDKLGKANYQLETCPADFVYIYLEESSCWKEGEESTRKKRKFSDEDKNGIKSSSVPEKIR